MPVQQRITYYVWCDACAWRPCPEWTASLVAANSTLNDHMREKHG